MQIKCNKCNKLIEPKVVRQSIHIGLYCPICNSYIKWANKSEKALLKDTILDNLHTLSDCEVAESLGIPRKQIIEKVKEDDLPWN